MSTGTLHTPLPTQYIPRVSIGMSVFNGEKYICTALNSLLAQTFLDFELIISDNASTDATEVICQEYASIDKRIRYVRQNKHLDAESNFQFVLDEAIGEFFMFAAYDDQWVDTFIEIMVHKLEENPDAFIAFCRYEEGDCAENSPKQIQTYLLEPGKTKKKNDSLFKYIIYGPEIGALNLVYGLMRRKELINSNAIRNFGGFGYGGETLMIANLLRYGNVVFSDELLWFKRVHHDSEGFRREEEAGKNSRSLQIGMLQGSFRTAQLRLRLAVNMHKVLGTLPDTDDIYFILRYFMSGYYFTKTILWLSSVYIKAVRRNFLVLTRRSHIAVK